MQNFYHDYANNIWSKTVTFSYTTGKGLHRYYAKINCNGKALQFEFHHLKKILVSKICGKSFYETRDILGCPPKSKMPEFREKIVNECRHQFEIHQVTWDESLIPEKLY